MELTVIKEKEMKLELITAESINSVRKYLSKRIIPKNYLIFGCRKEDEFLGVIVIDKLARDLYDISWIYVDEAYRGRGIANLMLREMMEIADMGNKMLCASFKNNDVIAHLLTKYNFEFEVRTGSTYRTKLSEFTEPFASYIDSDELSKKYVFYDAKASILNNIYLECINDEYTELRCSSRDILDADQSLSMIDVENGKTKAFVLASKTDEHTVEVKYLWGKHNSFTDIMSLLVAFKDNLEKHNPGVEYVEFTCATRSVYKLMKNVLKISGESQVKYIAAIRY